MATPRANARPQETILDYIRIERAIAFIDAHHTEQPTLADIAAHVGLSEFHFQRLFKRWCGISPKRFLQFLTVEYAKRLLKNSATVLQTTLETGLSGPSRLHDLFVTIEAVTPGEFRAGGDGVNIRYGFHTTPFGDCLLAATDRGICWLSFVTAGNETADASGDPYAFNVAEMRREWPDATLIEMPAATADVAARIFAETSGSTTAPPPANHKPLTVVARGTNFELQVWRALIRIPFGDVTSYGRLAESIGHPTAARAVGQAVARNPVSFLIPCHRVIRETGRFYHYRWSRIRKCALLGWEAAQRALWDDAEASESSE